MRTVLAVLGVVGAVALLSPAWAQTAPAPAARALSQKQRERIAIRAVQRALKPWLPRSDYVVVRPAIVPFNGDEHNPITGSGPIEIYVKQSGEGHGAWFRFSNPFYKRRFYVNVCPNGQACILGMEPDAALYRFGRALGPLGELALDTVTSKEGLSGTLQLALGTAVASAPSAQSVRELAVASLVSGAAFVVGAVKGRSEARKRALEDTCTWARELATKEQRYPHITAAYRHYKSRLGELKPGTRPVSLKRFAELLSAEGL